MQLSEQGGLGPVGGVGLHGAGQVLCQDAGGVVHTAVLLEEEGLEAGAVGQGDAAGDQQIGGVPVVEGLQLGGQIV